MDTLIIEKKDEVYLTVDCDPNIQREISEFFTFKVEHDCIRFSERSYLDKSLSKERHYMSLYVIKQLCYVIILVCNIY